jgi:hypothetical protein
MSLPPCVIVLFFVHQRIRLPAREPWPDLSIQQWPCQQPREHAAIRGYPDNILFFKQLETEGVSLPTVMAGWSGIDGVRMRISVTDVRSE